MADYYTEFSFMVPANNERERKYLRDRLKGYYPGEGEPKPTKSVVLDLKGYYIQSDACCVEDDTDGLWLHSDEWGDVDRVGHVVALWQTKFSKDIPIVIEFSCTCSKPRLYAFGGGVVVCYRGQMRFKNTWTLAQEFLKELGYEHDL